jgi:ribosomal protein L29
MEDYEEYFDKYYPEADVPGFKRELRDLYSKLSRKELEARLQEIEIKYLQLQFDEYNNAVEGIYKSDLHKAEKKIARSKAIREGKKADPVVIRTINAFRSEHPKGGYKKYENYCKELKVDPIGSSWFYEIIRRNSLK